MLLLGILLKQKMMKYKKSIQMSDLSQEDKNLINVNEF